MYIRYDTSYLPRSLKWIYLTLHLNSWELLAPFSSTWHRSTLHIQLSLKDFHLRMRLWNWLTTLLMRSPRMFMYLWTSNLTDCIHGALMMMAWECQTANLHVVSLKSAMMALTMLIPFLHMAQEWSLVCFRFVMKAMYLSPQSTIESSLLQHSPHVWKMLEVWSWTRVSQL